MNTPVPLFCWLRNLLVFESWYLMPSQLQKSNQGETQFVKSQVKVWLWFAVYNTLLCVRRSLEAMELDERSKLKKKVLFIQVKHEELEPGFKIDSLRYFRFSKVMTLIKRIKISHTEKRKKLVWKFPVPFSVTAFWISYMRSHRSAARRRCLICEHWPGEAISANNY